MLPVLIQSLLLASGGILSAGSITIVILLLISDRGWQNGLAYVLGYVGAYSLIGVAAVLIGTNTRQAESSSGGTVSSLLFILFSALLFWVALRNWRKRHAEQNEPPRIFAMLDSITPPRALAFGAAISVINFKNLAIFLSAISIVVLSDLLRSAKIGITLLVVLVFCSSVIAPVLIYLLFPQSANQRLNRIKQTLEKYSRPIGIWVPLLFAIIFLFRGVSGLL